MVRPLTDNPCPRDRTRGSVCNVAYRRGEVGQVARALLVLDALRGFRLGRELSELAQALGVSTRTVRRDLEELRTAGFEIESLLLAGKAAARLLERSHSHIAITRRERYTLLAIGSFFDVLRGTPLWEDVSSLQKKLEQRMGPEERAEHATFGDRFAYVPDGGTKAYQGKEDVLDGLLTGVLSRRVVRFVYQDARGRAQRGLLAPLTMLLYKHGLYVVACRLSSSEQVRAVALEPGTPVVVYAAERFSEVEPVRGSSFSPPPDFHLDRVLQGAFGVHVARDGKSHRAVIEFSAAKAAYVRARVWHPTQHIEELADGKVRLSLTCAALAPLVSWVLEWGPHARALSPPELVEQVTSELAAALAGYAVAEGPPSASPSPPAEAQPAEAQPAAEDPSA
ncbi:MAG TPA: transcriptional regulator [Kofleriaceae bacterium]|nr:transcriptional regulator [Kofleriaceae bacterium]